MTKDKVVPVPVIVPVNVLACEFCFSALEAGFFFFIRVGAKGTEEWHDEFGCKLAYKQRHHAMTRKANSLTRIKKGYSRFLF